MKSYSLQPCPCCGSTPMIGRMPGTQYKAIACSSDPACLVVPCVTSMNDAVEVWNETKHFSVKSKVLDTSKTY